MHGKNRAPLDARSGAYGGGPYVLAEFERTGHDSKMKRYTVLAIAVVLLFLGGAFLKMLGTRSGVTNAQVAQALPGDEIIEAPWISIDRAAVLPASDEVAWPWLVQLGKDRGGWYAPAWLEEIIRKHSASSVLVQFQSLKVGDVVPDWGGGTLTVLAISHNKYILYGSHFANEATSEPYNFTWALVLEGSLPKHTSLHLRLRIRRPSGSFTQYIPASLPGIIDLVADEIMFAGFAEKLRFAK